MQCLIQKAQKGDAQAMTKVFDSNKSTIWFLCRMLQQNETEADQAAICGSAEPTDDNGTIPAEEQPVIAGITVEAGENSTENVE